MLCPEGITLQQIAAAMGYANVSNASNIMAALEFAGQAFKCRAKLKNHERKQSSEVVYFPTQADCDAFMAVHREKIRQLALERKRSKVYRAEYYAKRNEQRRIARQAAVQKKAAERAQREALKLAEAEQRKERARLQREALAAVKERARAEAKKIRERMKAETKAAGKLAALKPAIPAPVSVSARGPAFVAGDPDTSRARITIAPPVPSRWAANDAAPVVNSAQCRGWAKAVTA